MGDVWDKTARVTLCAIKTVLDAIKTVLDGIKSQTDKLSFDGSSNLNVNVQAGGGGGSDVFGDNANKANISQSATSVLLKAANTNRKEIYIRNEPENKNDYLYISYSGAATLTEAIKLYNDEILIEDKYRGAIYGIWANAGSGYARITEITL